MHTLTYMFDFRNVHKSTVPWVPDIAPNMTRNVDTKLKNKEHLVN